MRSESYLRRVLVAALMGLTALTAQAAEPRWQRLDSSHFSLLTNADEASGHEVLVRFEQMRDVFAQLLMRSRVNLSKPIDIIALKTDDAFSQVCPTRPDEGIARGGFSLPGDDRVYFVLNLSKGDSWRSISYDFASYLLHYNYPPTQKWFDTGFAEYFASLYLSDTKAQIGGDPMALPAKPGSEPAASFMDLLSHAQWLTIPEFFGSQAGNAETPGSRRTLFHAQAWIVMNYLIANNKLPETGAYLGLVANEKLSVEEAVQKAFGESSAQLGQAVKDYFQSLQKQPTAKSDASSPPPGTQSLVPEAADVVGTSLHETLAFYAQAALAEMSLRMPEHREPARRELETLAADSRTETAIAHRALGWDHMVRKEADPAREEIFKALELDPKDPWAHYYQAVMKFDEFQATPQNAKGLANMMEDLHIVLDRFPEFAEAYYMLGWAQLEGGGVHAATDSLRAALQLNSRTSSYSLQMARIYLAGKNWDAATALLNRLAAGPDAQVADGARALLRDLPLLQKYGMAAAQTSSASAAAPSASPATASTHAPASPKAAEAEATDNSDETPAEPQIDKRPIQYLKAKLVAVDCSHPPAAVLTLSAGAKTLRLLTPDYKELTLVGEDQFSCDWKNRGVTVNYKAGGKADGDLISVEMH